MSMARRISVSEASQRAEGGVRGQRDIVHPGERMVGLERLGVKHVEPGMADVAAA